MEALGLPPNTSKASLTLNAGEVATLTYEVFVTEETATVLADLFDGQTLKVGETAVLTSYLVAPDEEESDES